jgi:hypothetical protein
LDVDFPAARRQIAALEHHSPTARAHALAAFVGLFDFADEQGMVESSAEDVADELGISRKGWLHYRAILEEAGLLEVGARRGGARRGFRLLPPTHR